MAHWLCSPNQGPYHERDEFLHRIALAFPQAIIEKTAAEASVLRHHEFLTRLDAPLVVLHNVIDESGKTAFVAIPLEGPKGYLWFQIHPCNSIMVEYLNPVDWEVCKPMQFGQFLFDSKHESTPDEWIACRSTMEALARALDYEYVIGED
jgi:hypothetical protein